jgi:hypothetical protein
MFLGYLRNIRGLCSSVTYLMFVQPLTTQLPYIPWDMFFGYKHMFINFLLRNICLFHVDPSNA